MQNRRIIGGHLAAAGVDRRALGRDQLDRSCLISHVLQGWATVLPLRSVEIFLRNAPLVAVPLHAPEAKNAVGLVAPWREPHTPVIDALLREARRLAGD